MTEGNVSEGHLKEVVATSLRIPVEQVTDSLEFSVVPQWDSLAHISLMLALEAEYGVSIPDDLVLELTSWPAIRDFVAQQSTHSAPSAQSAAPADG